jgi:VWFA-related protein
MLTTRTIRLLTRAALFTVAMLAQQRDLVFRANSNLVIVDVFVRDHSGKEIADLKKEDFTLLEDGKPQKVAVFDYQRLSATPMTTPPAAAATVAVTPAAPPERPSAAPALPGGARYQDRRLLVLLFDLSSMQPAEQVRATESARKFLAQQMTPSDLVSVMTFSNELKTTQEFTSDRDLLDEAIHKIAIGEGSDLNVVGDTGDSTSGEDTGAAFVADETEFNIFNTDMKLSALETAAKTLGALPEKKAVIYFSSGINKTGVENQSQLRSTVNAAVRSNVSFYPVDARGLTTIIPGGGDASHAAQRGSTLYSGAAQTSQRSSFNDSQETLVTLASDTGGKAFLDNNNLAQGIVQAQKDMGSYYILGYYSTNAALDGRYRRIQVKLSPKLQAKLDYREGYYAPKEFGKFTSSDKESQLQQALMLGDPMTDLPLALEVNYFRLGRGSYFVPVAVKIPGSAIELGKKGANEVTDFDFIGELRDSKGRLLPTGVRDGITVKLDADNVAKLEKRNFEYDTGFTLAPGEYHLKFLARENRTGKMGTFETAFKVPDLDAKSGYLPVSSVVWSNQREELVAAVGSATKQKKADAANPLVENGEKLIPSVTRVFRKDQNLYVYMEAYDPTLEPASRPNERRASLVASLSFMRGKTKAFETPPEHLDELAPKRNSTLPIQFQVPLAKLPPGRYTAQVSVVDQVGRRFAFSRAQVVLLP